MHPVSVLIQKYGGTSVDGPERIRAVARRVAAARTSGNQLLVVVSAMGQSTDDLLLTAGERVSMSLLAMALNDLGVPSISFTGSQSGILTDGVHGAARIVAV